ncbi:hypothetical protein [Massilia sp. TN1-12]|uniref:hypothetical protein n=1 Tax=Massilia paldalensis TaxID=3377675 RepID=UPI00384FF6F3
MDTTLRPTTTGSALGTVRSKGATALVPARAPDAAAGAAESTAAASSAKPAALRRSSARIDSGLQDGVARAQQALDYLERVASQLENLKGELTAKLAGSRNGGAVKNRPQLDTHVRQLARTLAARKSEGGGGIDGDLQFTAQPSTQRFRIRALDIDTLQQNAPQTIAFSIGGAGGPQLSATVTGEQTNEQLARAIDRAMAPLGVRAGLDGDGFVFSTAESNWPAVKDSIAVSGIGRVAAEEVQPSLAPQQWNTGAGSDALRQSLREVVQALERVHRSQSAASSALSSANVEVTQAQTPPPEVDLAAEDFSAAAASTDYESLLALSSALVGVSRERVLALLGLR